MKNKYSVLLAAESQTLRSVARLLLQPGIVPDEINISEREILRRMLQFAIDTLDDTERMLGE